MEGDLVVWRLVAPCNISPGRMCMYVENSFLIKAPFYVAQ